MEASLQRYIFDPVAEHAKNRPSAEKNIFSWNSVSVQRSSHLEARTFHTRTLPHRTRESLNGSGRSRAPTHVSLRKTPEIGRTSTSVGAAPQVNPTSQIFMVVTPTVTNRKDSPWVQVPFESRIPLSSEWECMALRTRGDV